MPDQVRGDLAQFWTALVYQLKSYARTRRFLGLLLFDIALSVAVLATDFYRGTDATRASFPTVTAFLGGFLGNVGTAAIISGAFLGGDALAVDLGGGPGYLMLTLPVRRRTLLLGRYAAAALAVAVIVVVYYLFAVAGGLAFYGTLPTVVALSLGCALLFVLAVLAVAFFFSSFFKNPAVAIIASLLILVLGFPVLTSIVSFVGYEPWYSLDYGSGIISNVFANPFRHETILPISGGQGITFNLHQWSPYLGEGAAILVAYLAVFLVLSYVVYRFKEVRG